MSYFKATDILPDDLLKIIQEYVDGKCIYIPRTIENRIEWGTKTKIRKELKSRNSQIYADYLKGNNSDFLSKKYFLSVKSIQRIIRQEKISK